MHNKIYQFIMRLGHVRRNGGETTRILEVVDGVEVWRKQGVGVRNEEIGNRKTNRMRRTRIGNKGLRVVGRRRGWTGRTERGWIVGDRARDGVDGVDGIRVRVEERRGRRSIRKNRKNRKNSRRRTGRRDTGKRRRRRRTRVRIGGVCEDGSRPWVREESLLEKGKRRRGKGKRTRRGRKKIRRRRRRRKRRGERNMRLRRDGNRRRIW
jgi:hypothetical protein